MKCTPNPGPYHNPSSRANATYRLQSTRRPPCEHLQLTVLKRRCSQVKSPMTTALRKRVLTVAAAAQAHPGGEATGQGGQDPGGMLSEAPQETGHGREKKVVTAMALVDLQHWAVWLGHTCAVILQS